MRSCMLALLLLAPTAPASVGALTSWQVPDELAAILRSARTDLEACPSGPSSSVRPSSKPGAFIGNGALAAVWIGVL